MFDLNHEKLNKEFSTGPSESITGIDCIFL